MRIQQYYIPGRKFNDNSNIIIDREGSTNISGDKVEFINKNKLNNFLPVLSGAKKIEEISNYPILDNTRTEEGMKFWNSYIRNNIPNTKNKDANLIRSFVENNEGRTWSSLSEEEKKNAFNTSQYKQFESNFPSIAPFIGFRSMEIPDADSITFSEYVDEINTFLDSDILSKPSVQSEINSEVEANREDIISNLLRNKKGLGLNSSKRDALVKLSFDFQGEPINLYTYLKDIPNGITDDAMASELESHPSLINNYVSGTNSELIRLTKAYAAAYNAVGENLTANVVGVNEELEDRAEKGASRLNNTKEDGIVAKSQRGEIPFAQGLKDPIKVLSIIADPNQTSRFRKSPNKDLDIESPNREAVISKNKFTNKPLTKATEDINPATLVASLKIDNPEVEGEVAEDVRKAIDSFYNNVDLEKRANNIYISNSIIEDIENGNESQLENLFKIIKGGEVDISLSKSGGREGMRYEHALPIKAIAETLRKLYNGYNEFLGDADIFNLTLFGEAAMNLIGSLYTIAYLDVIQDKNLESGGYVSSVTNAQLTDIDGLVDEYIEAMVDDNFSTADLRDLTDSIMDRYDVSGIGVTKLNDFFNGKNSMPLGIPRKALADTTTLEESKKPVLTNILFGYYG